jgi:hypothetical protein
MRRLGYVALLCAMLGFAARCPAAKDEVSRLINELKPAPLDWAVWAERILKHADGLRDDPGARMKLLDKAYEYGIKHRSGCPTAIEAARKAAQGAEPTQKPAWLWRLVDAHKLALRGAPAKERNKAGATLVDRQIAAADALADMQEIDEALRCYNDALPTARRYAPIREDEIAAKIRELTTRRRVDADVARCKALLAKDPANLAARRKLIRLYLLELDEPAEARKLLTAAVDEQWRTYVPLAVRGAARLDDEACVEQMGDWYKEVLAEGEDLTLKGKANALVTARTYYERFLELHPKRDIANARARAKLVKLESLLADLQPRSLPRKSHWHKRGNGPWEERREGLRLYGTAHRKGNYMTTRRCYDLIKSSVFVKWKPHGDKQYAGFWCGIDGGFFAACSVHHHFRDPVLSEDTWYYTRITLNEDKSYVVLTCSGDYDGKGGKVVMKHKGTASKEAWKLAKAARIFLRIGDNYAGRKAWVSVAETYARENRRK